MNNYLENKIKETGGYKESDLPFRYYYSDYSKGFSGFTIHWHDEVEIFYIEKGQGSFVIDNEDYVVSEGDIVYIAPRLMHSGHAIDNKNFITKCYVVDSQYLLSHSGEYNTDKYFSNLMNAKISSAIIKKDDVDYDDFKDALLNIDRCIQEKDIAYQIEIKMYFYKFFAQLYKNNYLTITGFKHIDNDTEEIVKKAINYIQSNFNKPLSVQEIANAVGLSSSYFMNVFKQHTKMTCIKYINSFRLNLAETMLKETDESVLQICHECGFNNLSLFNREFKKTYSNTPTQHRKNYRGEAKKAFVDHGYSSGVTHIVHKNKN